MTKASLSGALIDVGGTLWPDRWPPSVDPLYLDRLGNALPNESVEARRRLLAEFHRRDPAFGDDPTQDTRAMVEDSLAACNLDAADADIDVILSAMELPAHGVIEPFEGAEDLLGSVKDSGLRCVLVSNATWRTADGYRRDFRDFGLGSYIDDVISSVDVGFRKPHRRFFDAALRAAGVPAQSCVIVGDSEAKDIAPAVALGMHAVRVAIEEPPPPQTSAHARACSLLEAATIVRKWGSG